MKQKICLVLFLVLSIMAAGCSNQNNSNISEYESTSPSSKNNSTSEDGKTEDSAEMDTSGIFSDRDCDAGYDKILTSRPAAAV